MNRDVQIKGPRSNHIVSDRSATPTIKINKIALISTQEHHATYKTIYTRELKFINGYRFIFALVTFERKSFLMHVRISIRV